MPGPIFLQGDLCPGGLSLRGSLGRSPLPRIRKPGSTHPTGMLSCHDLPSFSALSVVSLGWDGMGGGVA